MTSLEVRPGPLPPIVRPPASKSYANRALILASITDRPIVLRDLPVSSDVTLLIAALEKIGIEIEPREEGILVKNSFPFCEQDGAEIEVGEGGTTARFLASLLLLGKKAYTLLLGKRLKERPWDEFVQFVRGHGGRAELTGERLMLQGPLDLPSRIEIDCVRTTQFASGLRLAYSAKNIKVVPINLRSSQSYWEMTEELIATFSNIQEFKVPLDWSSASYPLAFGALNHSIYFPGLKVDKYQSDARFYDLLIHLQAIRSHKDGIEVVPFNELREVLLDVSDCLDLVPTLGFFLSHIQGTHALTGIANLAHKESDRLSEIRDLLKKFDRQTRQVGDTLFIEGCSEKILRKVDIFLPNDHRMVMAAALFLRHHSGGAVSPSAAVNKSYPDFFSLFSHIDLT